MNFLILYLAVIILVSLTLFLFKGKANKKFNIYLKILTIIFCAIGFFRFMLSDSFIWVMKESYYGNVYYDKVDILQSILRWATYMNYIILPMAVFFESKLWRNIAVYVLLPITLVSIIFYNDFMAYFLHASGRGLKLTPALRHMYFSAELLLAVSIPALIYIKYKHRFDYKNKQEWLHFGLALPLIILQCIPIYLPQSIIGHTDIKVDVFTSFHVLWLSVTILQVLGLYYYFRFKDYSSRYMLVMFLSLVLFFEYNSMYLMGFSIPRLPIQLCNLGAYLFLIAMITKNQPLFNFSFLANTVGALIAMFAPDVSGGALSFWNVHFMIEHMLVFSKPILAMWLRIFPRIDSKALKHFTIGFLIYFLFCLTSGTILNGFAKETGFTVNYFYIFNLKKAFGYFPFLAFSAKYKIEFSRYVLYPVFQMCIWLGFQFLTWLFYLLIKKMYKVSDDKLELRHSRIELYEKITGKKSKAPLEFKD